MTRKWIYKKLIYVFLALFLLVIALVGGRGVIPAYAETSDYTSALTDLQKDSSFNINDYPDEADDYSIQVIQITESANNELFVYTYQPSQKTTYLVATDINMSLSESVNGTKLYSLTLINISGVLGKYKVNDFTVRADITRYYNITSIYRAWNSAIDTPGENGNTINKVSYEVGKLYTATTTDDSKVSYECIESKVITITDKYVGTIQYLDGYWLFGKDSCNSHYIAFSTDYDIEKLYEADVSYVEQDREISGIIAPITGDLTETSDKRSEPREKEIQIKDQDTAENDGSGWFGKKEIRNRIETVSDFIKNEDLTEENKKELQGKQWILRFTETELKITVVPPSGIATPGYYKRESTVVSEVTILRLKFETDGKVYNLGVVDNKQTGDGKPDNNNTSGRLPKLPSLSDILDDILDALKIIGIISGSILVGAGLVWLIVQIAQIIAIGRRK